MSKYFETPFANGGDKTSVPDASQPSGDVSYAEGWTADYEKDQATDPAAKDVGRQQENQLKHDITEAIKQIQETGVLPYRADVNYVVDAIVTGGDSLSYRALIANGPASSVVDPVGDLTATWTGAYAEANQGVTGGYKNKIINGDFRVAQRGTSGTAIGTGYPSIDRMVVNSGTLLEQVQAAGLEGQVFAGKVNRPSANAVIKLPIEIEVGDAGEFALGKEYIFSVYVKADANSNLYLIRDWADSSIDSINDVAEGGTNLVGSVDGTWQRRFLKFAIQSAPAATNRCYRLVFYADVAAGVDAFYAGLQFEEAAPNQTEPSEFEHRPIGTELALCQRYYQFSTRQYMYIVTNSPNSRRYEVPRPVDMRANPTMTGTFTNGGASPTLTGYTDRYYAAVNDAPSGSGSWVADVASDAEL